MTGAAQTFREACADVVRLRLERLDGEATVAHLCASLRWPRQRVQRALLDLSATGAVALRFKPAGVIVGATLLPRIDAP